MSRFNYSAYATFQESQYQPGKIFDLSDNDGISVVPQGGPIPYGRVIVSGLATHAATNAGLNLGARHYTHNHTGSLPDKNGDWLRDCDLDDTYANLGFALPVDAAGDLMVEGIGMWTEFGRTLNAGLAQPFGLGECDYQKERCGEAGLAREGRIVVYTETDINRGDDLFFRTVVSAAQATDGVSLLGGFSNVGGADFQAFPYGSVFEPGPAGGHFVLSLNMQK